MGREPRIVVVAACLALLAGCPAILDLEQPVFAPDAGVDTAPEVRRDAMVARTCPAAPAGCALFECAVSTSCYYVCEAQVHWDTAESYCKEVGGLATIDAQAEQECVTAASHPTNSSPVWIGFFQSTSAGEPANGWSWAYGASPYTNWATYEPIDLAGDQDCAAMTSGGEWSDTPCSYTRRFVCELP
jgi:hypothetical protein